MGHDDVIAMPGRGPVRPAYALGVACPAIVDSDGTVGGVLAMSCALLGGVLALSASLDVLEPLEVIVLENALADRASVGGDRACSMMSQNHAHSNGIVLLHACPQKCKRCPTSAAEISCPCACLLGVALPIEMEQY